MSLVGGDDEVTGPSRRTLFALSTLRPLTLNILAAWSSGPPSFGQICHTLLASTDALPLFRFEQPFGAFLGQR
jgi:hypothetical protein